MLKFTWLDPGDIHVASAQEGAFRLGIQFTDNDIAISRHAEIRLGPGGRAQAELLGVQQ